MWSSPRLLKSLVETDRDKRESFRNVKPRDEGEHGENKEGEERARELWVIHYVYTVVSSF